jgi:hypothetical protein
MKTTSCISKAILTGLIILTTLIAGFTNGTAWAGRFDATTTVTVLTVPLSSTEAEMLTFMREEEKLARDVYLAMYQKWGAVTFSNIASSEQSHMDTMKKMLDKYKLPDPVQPALGVFTNADLQGKYDQLLAAGSQSLVNALYVGATIEEIDMVDIQHAIDVTTHVDIDTAYLNLLEGSKSHLRAYVKALAAQGVTYAPQFLSQELYDAIIGL